MLCWFLQKMAVKIKPLGTFYIQYHIKLKRGFFPIMDQKTDDRVRKGKSVLKGRFFCLFSLNF